MSDLASADRVVFHLLIASHLKGPERTTDLLVISD
jgi:hypothetical protein